MSAEGALAIVTLQIGGHTLLLLPEKAIFLPEFETLLVADVHIGKATSFRRLGVPVPHGTTDETLAVLSRLVRRLDAKRIVFLGDFLHARGGRSVDAFTSIAQWRASHATIDMQIVRGNHDRRAGDPPREVGIACVDGPVLDGRFALTHHPVGVSGSYALAGHIHPCAVLTGPARQRERLPCFWFGRDVGVLPAFGEFTGCAEVNAQAGDQVWVVADETVELVASSTPTGSRSGDM